MEISHGDLTTHNVMVSEGDLYLIDFGLSRLSPNWSILDSIYGPQGVLGLKSYKIHDAIEIVCEGYIDSESQIVIQKGYQSSRDFTKSWKGQVSRIGRNNESSLCHRKPK